MKVPSPGVIFVPFAVVLCAVLTQAQPGPCNEQQIRDAARNQKFAYTEDTFFWSGAFDKPLIGKAAREEASKKLQAERANERRTQNPRQIVVSGSGNMGYEYGIGEVTFDDRKSGKPVSFQVGYLRVWKAIDGECKIAASMYRPMEDCGSPNRCALH